MTDREKHAAPAKHINWKCRKSAKSPGKQGEIRHTNPTEECRLPPLVLSSEQRTVDGCADEAANACCRSSDPDERKVRGVENIPVPTNAIPMRALKGA